MLAQRLPANITGKSGPADRWVAAMRAGDVHAAFAVNDQVLAARDPATRDDPARPYHERWVWDGRPLDGRRVLVRCYHGLGDTLQFCRFLAPLRCRAAHVTMEAQPPLIPLLRRLPGIDRLHPFDPAHPLPPADCDIEVMELAHALRQPPDPAPYLHAEAARGGGVGFCWQGGGWDPARDIPAPKLRPLATGVRAISLQRGPAAAAAPALGAHDPLDGDMDVLALAHLVAGLRAVFTVDTMVAHLAAALGRPTFVLLKHDPDWRWGHSGRTPWYGSVRTIRQPAPGDWDGAIDQALQLWGASQVQGM